MKIALQYVCIYIFNLNSFFNWFAAFNFMMGGDKLQLHGAQCLGHEFKWQHEASRSHWKTEENAYWGSVLKSKWWRFILTYQCGIIKLYHNTKLSFQQTIHTVYCSNDPNGCGFKTYQLNRHIPQGIITEISKYYQNHLKAMITSILASVIGMKIQFNW